MPMSDTCNIFVKTISFSLELFHGYVLWDIERRIGLLFWRPLRK